MRYVEDHRRQTHSRIVENASYGLRQKGAKGLSVVDLMKLAGLTHGGFYNHFDSRAALVGEAIAFAMDQMTERWKKLANGKANGERFEALIADYLSPRHRDNPKHGCALPTLAADVARSSPSEQRALASKLEKMIDVFVELLPDEAPRTGPPNRDGRYRNHGWIDGAVACRRRGETFRQHSRCRTHDRRRPDSEAPAKNNKGDALRKIIT